MSDLDMLSECLQCITVKRCISLDLFLTLDFSRAKISFINYIKIFFFIFMFFLTSAMVRLPDVQIIEHLFIFEYEVLH